MKKKILLLAAVVLLTQLAVADGHVEFPDRTGDDAINYNTDEGFEIVCEPNAGSCPEDSDDIKVDLCGYEEGVEGAGPQIRDWDGDGDDEYKYFTGFNIPAEAKCDIGVNYFAFELLSNGNVVDRGGELELDVATETDNLLVRINTNGLIYDPGDKDGILSDFRLTNDGNANQGEIVVSEWDNDGDHDRATKTPKFNFVLDTDTRFLNSFLASPYPIDCPSSHSSYEEDDNDNCQVATTEFTYDWDDVGVSKCVDGVGCRSGYLSGSVYYKTNGEIVVGQKYDDGGPPDYLTENKFHLCHSSVDSTRGNAVYSPGSNSQYSYDQFRCNRQGEWENVALCEDGIDNNENGATDLNDALCDNSWQNSEIEPELCEEPRVGELATSYEDPDTGETYDEGTKVAFHSYGDDFIDDTSDCGYANFDPEVDYSGEPPELFRCTSSGGYSSYSSTDSEDNGNAVTSDAYLTYLCDELSEIISTETWSAHSGSMPMAEYFIAKDDIPIGFNKYATSGGFQNKFYESLHSAEEEHYESVSVYCDNEPNTDDPTLVHECWTTEHNNDSYEPISLMDLGDGYESGDFLDSWMIANATGDSTDKIYSEWGEPDRDEVFNGGFAGKCDTGLNWQYVDDNNRWECSGELNWEHQYVVPDLPPGSNGDETVGVFIRNKTFNTGDNVRTGQQSLEYQWFADQDENLDVNYADVMCFAGTSYSDDLSSDKQFSKQLEVPDEVSEAFFKVTGTIDMSEHDAYTCKWQFNATNENGVEKIFNDDGDMPQPVSDQKLEDLGVEGSNANPGDLDSVSETSTTEIESSYQ